jgi:predicted outer membrane protein
MKHFGLCLVLVIPCLGLACGGDDNNGENTGGGRDASVADVVVPDASGDAEDAGLAADAATLTDAQIVGFVVAANTGEVEEALLAVGAGDGGAVEPDAGFDAGPARASDPAVKAFANMMIMDHSMSNTAVEALGIAPGISAVQTNLHASALMTIAQLTPLSGAAFDLGYMQAQVTAHTTVRDIVRDQLIPGASSAPLKVFLQNMLLPTVEAHLADATSLVASLTDGGAPAVPDASVVDASADADAASHD